MYKTKILQLVALLIIASHLPGCTYSSPKTMVRIENMSRRANSYSFAVVLSYRKYREPTGFINTVPNGGVQTIMEESVLFYLCNAVTKEATFLAEIKAPFMGMNRLRPWLGGWDKDSFYFSLTDGQSWEADYGHFYFKMGQGGAFRQVQLDALPHQPGGSLARMVGERNYLRLSTDNKPLAITARTGDGGEFLPIFIVDEENGVIVPVNN